jgi:hypothetical protein
MLLLTHHLVFGHTTTGDAMRALSEAVFIIDADDKKALDEKLAAAGDTSERDHAYYKRRCRVSIPGPQLLLERVQAWWDTYKDACDPAGVCLFLESAATTHKNQVLLINAGLLSGEQPWLLQHPTDFALANQCQMCLASITNSAEMGLCKLMSCDACMVSAKQTMH